MRSKSVACAPDSSYIHLLSLYHSLLKKQQSLGEAFPKKRIEQLFGVINSIGMYHAKQGYLSVAQQWLLKSQKYSQNNLKLSIILHNNMACLYKKLKNYPQALANLQQALQKISICFESGLMDNQQHDKSISQCCLNLCAVRSAMDQHHEALTQAMKSVSIMQPHAEKGQQYFLQSFIVAKYNQAVQLEHIYQLPSALKSYISVLKFIGKQNLKGKFKIQSKITKAIKQIKKKIHQSGIKLNEVNTQIQSQSRKKSVRKSRAESRKDTVRILLKNNLEQQFSSVFTDKCFPDELPSHRSFMKKLQKQIQEPQYQSTKQNIDQVKIKFNDDKRNCRELYQRSIHKRRIMMPVNPN